MSGSDQASALATLPLGGYPAILAQCRVTGATDSCRGVLDDCLGYLDGQLRGTATGTARRAARQTLRELADLIASNRLGLTGGDYERLLGRLAAIFAIGAPLTAGSVLVSMAPSYAGVVAAIRRACPSCDYDGPVGQLLIYMARLFLDRRNGWTSIYRSIQAISDGVAAKRRLDDAEFSRVQEWVDSGASNLFPIQRELDRAIARLAQEAAHLDSTITRKARALERSARRPRTNAVRDNVVSLSVWRERREIADLRRRRRQLLDQIETKRGIKDLIDDDIRDVDDSLRAARRAYFVRLAWSAP
jgi:hypothetical protein